MQAGGVIDLHGATGLVQQYSRNYHEVLERTKIAARGKIELIADYLKMSAITTKAGESTAFIGKTGIEDGTEQLKSSEYRAIGDGFHSVERNQHQTSTHQAGGEINYLSLKGSIALCAVTLKAIKAKMRAGVDVISHKVRNMINTVTQYEQKKSRWGGLVKKKVTHHHQSQQNTSVGSDFQIADDLKIFAENLIKLEQVFSSANSNLFKANVVEFKAGQSSYDMQSQTSSVDLFWQKSVSEKVSSTTNLPCIFKDSGTIQVEAGKTILEQMDGKLSVWAKNMVDTNGNAVAPIVKMLHDHYHSESDVKQGPGVGLAIIVTIAVAVATSGTGTELAQSACGAAADSFTAVMLEAGVTSLASSAAIGLLANEGDPFAAAKSLTSSDNLKGLLISLATAGALHHLQDLGNISKMADGLPKDMLVKMKETLVSFGVGSVINNESGDLGLSMLNGILSCLAGHLSKDVELSKSASADSEFAKAAKHGIINGLTSYAATGEENAALCSAAGAMASSLYFSESSKDKEATMREKAAAYKQQAGISGDTRAVGFDGGPGRSYGRGLSSKEQKKRELVGGLAAMLIAKNGQGVQAGADGARNVGVGQEKAAKDRLEAAQETKVDSNFQLSDQALHQDQDTEISLENDKEKLKNIYIQKIIGEFKSKYSTKFSKLSDEHIYIHILSNYGATIDLCLDDIEKAGHGNIKLGLHRIGIAKYTQQQHNEEIKKEECVAPIAGYYILLGMSAAFAPIFINCYQRFMDYDFSQEQPSNFNSSNDSSSSSTVLPIHKQDKGDNIEIFPVDDEKYELGSFGNDDLESFEIPGFYEGDRGISPQNLQTPGYGMTEEDKRFFDTLHIFKRSGDLNSSNKSGGSGGSGGAKNLIKSVDPKDLVPTHSPIYGKNRLKEFVKKIQKEGIQESIKFVEHNGRKYVVDGHHRLYAARTLKYDKIPVEAVELPYKGYKTVADLTYSP